MLGRSEASFIPAAMLAYSLQPLIIPLERKEKCSVKLLSLGPCLQP